MNVDGTNEEIIVNDPFTGDWRSCDPDDLVLSPDGRWLAFTAGCGSGSEIGIGLIDLKDLNIVQPVYNAQSPAWSPDGRSLAFAKISTGDNWDIFVINIDGTGLRRLTDDPASDTKPAWSPDGKYIAFTSNRTGQAELYLMNFDGTGQVRLTDGGASSPSWGPGN